ncbi:MAG TPA: PAS domain S-box protein [Candidatus Limnocylindrales bacterium]|nr:PAS domain S-box protein [Candidatus Limnocylindrales bacterium]
MRIRARGLLAAARQGRGGRVLVFTYLLLGLGLIAYRLSSDGFGADLAYLLVSLLPLVAIPLGVLIFRPRSAWPWLLLAAGQAAFFVGDVVWTIDAATDGASFPGMADIPYLAGYPLLAVALLQFVRMRRPRYRLVPSIDAFAVGIAFAMVLWLVLFERFIHSESMALSDKLALTAYPMGDVLLLAAATYMLFAARGLRHNAQRLLILALIALFLADVLYTGMILDVGYRAGLPDAFWLGSYVLFGLAALVPSMRSMTQAEPQADREHPGWRLLVPALAFAFVPIFAAVQLLVHGHVDIEVLVVVEVLLAGLLMLRLYDMARTALADQQRHATLLSRGSTAFMLVSPGGLVTYYSPPPGSALWLDGEDPVGRSVRSVLREAARDPAAVDRFLDAVAANGDGAEADLTLRTASGAPRQMRLSGRLRTSPRALAGMVIDYRDVTLQRETMHQLQEQARILGSIREAVIVGDLAGNVVHWNEGAARIFGYRPEEMLGRSLAIVYPNADPVQMRAELAAIGAGEEFEGDWEGRRRDGSTVIVDVHTSPMYGPDGSVVGFIGVSSDVTERRMQERRTQRLAAAIEQSSEAVLIASRDGTVEYVNPAFERVTGWASSEIVGGNPRVLKSGQQSESFYRAMWQTLQAGKPWVADMVNRRRDGSLYEAETVISPIRAESGETDGFVSVSRDVTEERRLAQRADRLTRERAVIGQTLRELDPNLAPEETAGRVCRQIANLSEIAFAALYVFSPDGKAVPYGFAVADGNEGPLYALPKSRSKYLRDRAERGPWIEEWEQTSGHPYAQIFAALGVRACAYAPVKNGDAVMGLLIIGSARDGAEQVLSDALPALLEFADIVSAQTGPAVVERYERRVARELIARTIRLREYRMAYQPILDLEVGSVVGYEALARFDDGVAPDVRLAQAAAVELDRDLELALLRAAVQDAARLPAGSWLSLNASPSLVGDKRLAKVLAEADRQVLLEITEHSAIDDYAAFRLAAGALGDHVRLAIDDAGAGFASLRHIIEVRPAMVKLDRALIQGLAGDGARQALISGVSHFAASSGFQVLAEGVEQPDELEALRRLGIRLAQGYLLGRPLSLDEAAAYSSPAFVRDAIVPADQVQIVWPQVVHADASRGDETPSAAAVAPPLLMKNGRPFRHGGRAAK